MARLVADFRCGVRKNYDEPVRPYRRFRRVRPGSEGFTPIQCANGVPTRPEAAKLAHAHEKNAYLQVGDSEVLYFR